jgi:lysylphosphatidylglycerol synthetase-like protein (DUF2156 family)
MLSGFAITSAALCIVACIALAFWSEAKYRSYSRLPVHFDISLKADKFASRSFVLWMMPAVSISIVGLIIGATLLFPQSVNGDPSVGLTFASILLVITHLFILWLIGRWARGEA